MIVTMQITCSTCRLSNFTRENAPEHAKEYAYTGYTNGSYNLLHEGKKRNLTNSSKGKRNLP